MDIKQLPPVGEKVSPIFVENSLEDSYVDYKLSKIVRQGEGNPIIEYSNNLKLIKDRSSVNVDDGGVIFGTGMSTVLLELSKMVDYDKFKYLAYTNNTVNRVNSLVREMKYGKNPAKFIIGETLIFSESYGDSYKNSDEFVVETLEISSKEVILDTVSYIGEKIEFKQTFKTYLINGDIHVLHEDAENEYKYLLDNFLKNCKDPMKKWPWQTLSYLREEVFANINYNYALTVHKSQGSTFHTVFVDMADIGRNKSSEEKKQMLYTAITRASNYVHIINF